MKRRIKVVESSISNRMNGVASVDTVREIYRAYNISPVGVPIGRLDKIKSLDGDVYKIRPMEDLEDRIYVRWDGDTKVIDTSWAVFKYVNGYWKQVTKWFMRFGDAERHMKKLAGVNARLVS